MAGDFFSETIVKEGVRSRLKDIPQNFIEEETMKKECVGVVEGFYNGGKEVLYKESGIADRLGLVLDFYGQVKEVMGINAELNFVPMSGKTLGSFNPATNCIELNIGHLETPDCKDLLNTVLHESRHAFQYRAIEHPASVSVNPELIDIWKNNFNHYITSGLDYEAYYNQPVEADAYAFADDILNRVNVSNKNFA